MPVQGMRGEYSATDRGWTTEGCFMNVCWLFIGFLFGIVAAMTFVYLTDGYSGRSIVSHGCAHYDTETGSFTWNIP